MILFWEDRMAERWELVPHQGLRSGDVEVLLRTGRDRLRAALAGRFGAPDENRPYEDQFSNEHTTLFLRYDDGLLTSILFIAGSLQYDGIELYDTTFGTLEPALTARGFELREPVEFTDGMDVPGLGVNIATREDVGSDGDEIEWVALGV
ncbi:hypothetical protein ACGFJ7_30350 [Actinoplanes sp. NPDC048988]|uniref:hypothetical protein n=1 Tax=Actinoplanes sp. NPDC048988 TaxID=3363901 RepID=UPI0037190643